LQQERSIHPQEMIVTPKASTSIRSRIDRLREVSGTTTTRMHRKGRALGLGKKLRRAVYVNVCIYISEGTSRAYTRAKARGATPELRRVTDPALCHTRGQALHTDHHR